jgi:hypothetical protein
MTVPPTTPQEKILKRVLLVSAIDGWGIIGVAALSLVLTLLFGELLGVAVSLLVLAAGVMEIRGRRQLQRRDPTGMKWLVRAQLFLLTVMLVYCARCLGSFDAGYVQDQLIPEVRQNLLLAGINFDDVLKESNLTANELVPLVHIMFVVIYGTVAFVSLLFQGGLALYYRSRTRVVTEALATPPEVNNPSVL